jgi:hypothetical protein
MQVFLDACSIACDTGLVHLFTPTHLQVPASITSFVDDILLFLLTLQEYVRSGLCSLHKDIKTHMPSSHFTCVVVPRITYTIGQGV